MSNIFIQRGVPLEIKYSYTRELNSSGKKADVPVDTFYILDKDGNEVLDIDWGYGLTFFYTEENTFDLYLSIWNTEILEVGEYTYQFVIRNNHGEIWEIKKGNIKVSDDECEDMEKYEIVSKKREKRWWDLDFDRKDFVNVYEQRRRLSICKSCPFLVDGVCQECFCLMRLKVKQSDSRCPKDKW